MSAADQAAQVTAESGSNLWYVGRLLSPHRRRLFEASYASMRLVDDFVDDDFLTRLPVDRDRDRSSAISCVDDWERACLLAIAEGHLPPDTPLVFKGAVEALAELPEPSKPPKRAWSAMARAMRHDVNETRLNHWSDFLSYCEGATVAPAAVFLHVLTCEDFKDGKLKARLDETSLFDTARPMAVFCYLVHIVRDIAKDAAAPEQLLTVPQELLTHHGIDREKIRIGEEGALSLLKDLLHRAERYRLETEAARASLNPALARREALVLDALLGIYRGLHDRLNADPVAALRGDPMPTDRIRKAVFKGLGLK